MFVGIPGFLLAINARGKGTWMWRRDVDEREAAKDKHYQDIITEKDRTIEALRAEHAREIANLNEQHDKRVEDLTAQWQWQLSGVTTERDLLRQRGEEQAALLARITEVMEKGLDAFMKNIARLIQESIAAALGKGP